MATTTSLLIRSAKRTGLTELKTLFPQESQIIPAGHRTPIMLDLQCSDCLQGLQTDPNHASLERCLIPAPSEK